MSVSVCTQHGSERGWATVAVEGTGKESGGKGVTAACQPPHPLPLPQGAIQHPPDNFTLTHINRENIMTELTVIGCVLTSSCKMSCHSKDDKESFGLNPD